MEEGKAPLETIEPGMPVYGIDGGELGTVEAVDGDTIRLLSHTVPATAVARVDDTGVHLHIARAAFAAASPETADAPVRGEA